MSVSISEFIICDQNHSLRWNGTAMGYLCTSIYFTKFLKKDNANYLRLVYTQNPVYGTSKKRNKKGSHYLGQFPQLL